MEPVSTPANQWGTVFSQVLLLGLIVAVFYFILIRPQQKQQKKHQQLISSLKKGDEVILSSGIVGRIVAAQDKFLTLEVADKTKIKVLKQAVQACTGSSQASLPESDGSKI